MRLGFKVRQYDLNCICTCSWHGVWWTGKFVLDNVESELSGVTEYMHIELFL